MAAGGLVAGPGQGRVRHLHRAGRPIAVAAPPPPPARRREWLTIPNLITLARIGMVPVFVALSLTGHTVAALWTFVIASASDSLDGLLARLLDQRSHLGGILDPIADKLLVLSALVTLIYVGRLPWWLMALVVFRDVWMVVGAMVVRRKRLEIPTSPTRVGKYATLGLLTAVVLALVTQALGKSPVLEAYTAVIGFIAGVCVVASTVQYFHRFGYLFWAPRRPEGA